MVGFQYPTKFLNETFVALHLKILYLSPLVVRIVVEIEMIVVELKAEMLAELMIDSLMVVKLGFEMLLVQELGMLIELVLE